MKYTQIKQRKVAEMLDAARRGAMEEVEAARREVEAMVARYQEKSRELADEMPAKYKEEGEKAIAAIDAVVDNARQQVDAIAEGLKAVAKVNLITGVVSNLGRLQAQRDRQLLSMASGIMYPPQAMTFTSPFNRTMASTVASAPLLNFDQAQHFIADPDHPFSHLSMVSGVMYPQSAMTFTSPFNRTMTSAVEPTELLIEQSLSSDPWWSPLATTASEGWRWYDATVNDRLRDIPATFQLMRNLTLGDNPLSGYRDENFPQQRNMTEWLLNTMQENGDGPVARIIDDNFPLSLPHFIGMVRTDAPWDYKVELNALIDDDPSFSTIELAGQEIDYDALANIHFGYVGRAAGIPQWLLEAGAGVFNVKDNGLKKTWQWFDTWGDDPRDTAALRVGIELYNDSDLSEENLATTLKEYEAQMSGEEPLGRFHKGVAAWQGIGENSQVIINHLRNKVTGWLNPPSDANLNQLPAPVPVPEASDNYHPPAVRPSPASTPPSAINQETPAIVPVPTPPEEEQEK